MSLIKDETNKAKAWVDTWQKARLSLEQLKKSELRSPDYYEKNLPMLNEMIEYALQQGTPRRSTGLIELQRYFMKLKTK